MIQFFYVEHDEKLVLENLGLRIFYPRRQLKAGPLDHFVYEAEASYLGVSRLSLPSGGKKLSSGLAVLIVCLDFPQFVDASNLTALHLNGLPEHASFQTAYEAFPNMQIRDLSSQDSMPIL